MNNPPNNYRPFSWPECKLLVDSCYKIISTRNLVSLIDAEENYNTRLSMNNTKDYNNIKVLVYS